jgi:hypothetical protein
VCEKEREETKEGGREKEARVVERVRM